MLNIDKMNWIDSWYLVYTNSASMQYSYKNKTWQYIIILYTVKLCETETDFLMTNQIYGEC